MMFLQSKLMNKLINNTIKTFMENNPSLRFHRLSVSISVLLGEAWQEGWCPSWGVSPSALLGGA